MAAKYLSRFVHRCCAAPTRNVGRLHRLLSQNMVSCLHRIVLSEIGSKLETPVSSFRHKLPHGLQNMSVCMSACACGCAHRGVCIGVCACQTVCILLKIRGRETGDDAVFDEREKVQCTLLLQLSWRGKLQSSQKY